MNRDEKIKAFLKKYRFYSPVPYEIQRKMHRSKKRILKKIFEEESRSNIFNNTGISIFCFLERHGFVYPLTRVIAAVKTTSLIAASIITVFVLSAILNITPPEKNKTISGLKEVCVIDAKGNAVIHNPGSKPKNASIKDAVAEKGIISTGEKSSVTAQINETATIYLPEKSRIQINSTGSKRITKITLKKGSVYSIVRKQRNIIYQVWTPSAVVGVKGTEFLITYSNNISSVELLRGRISVYRINNQKKEIPLEEKHIIYINKNQREKIVPMGRLRQLELEKLSLNPYIENINTKSADEIKNIFASIKKREQEIDKKIDQLKKMIKKRREEWEKLLPLDKLRKLGKKLYMFHMNDSAKIAGTVVKQDKKIITIDTGAGKINLPKKDIIRRVPIE